MTTASRTTIAPVILRRLLRNAVVVVAVTAIFGFKAVERSAVSAAPLELASR